MCTQKSTLIVLALTEILSKVVLHVKMQKTHKVISCLNKRSTNKWWIGAHPVLWLLQCCQTFFPLQNQEQRFENHPEWVALARCELHGALSCMNTKSPDLNHWENQIKSKRDRWPNNIWGYVYFALEKASSSSSKAGWGRILFSTASVKLVLMLLIID